MTQRNPYESSGKVIGMCVVVVIFALVMFLIDYADAQELPDIEVTPPKVDAWEPYVPRETLLPVVVMPKEAPVLIWQPKGSPMTTIKQGEHVIICTTLNGLTSCQ